MKEITRYAFSWNMTIRTLEIILFYASFSMSLHNEKTRRALSYCYYK